MTQLRQIQENLQAHLLASDEHIANYITEPTQDRVKERLAIYSDAYRFRLLEVLEKDFSILKKLLGETIFTKLGFAYIAAYPSHYFSINHVGQHMQQFLITTKPYAEQPYLSELASFSWALNSTIDAPDSPVLTIDDVSAIPQESWPNMCLTLHSSVQLLAWHWNTLAIWEGLALDKEVPKPIQQDAESYCAVWRKDLQPYYCPLAKEGALAMQALQKNQSFGEVCESLLECLPEDQIASHVVNLLLQWLHDGMLSQVEVKA